MRKVEDLPWQSLSFNMCRHQERVFNFSQDSRKLRVTEVLLGNEVTCVRAVIKRDCESNDHWQVPVDFSISTPC